MLAAHAWPASASHTTRSPRYCLGLSCRALNPDASSCLWINNLLAQAWPHLERFGCRFLKSGDFLESQINATTFWRPPVLRSSYIKVQGVALGQVGEGGRVGAVAPAWRVPVLLSTCGWAMGCSISAQSWMQNAMSLLQQGTAASGQATVAGRQLSLHARLSAACISRPALHAHKCRSRRG